MRSGRVGAKGGRAAAGGSDVDTLGDEEVRVGKKKTAEKNVKWDQHLIF